MKNPLYRKIGIASIIMAVSVVSSRLLGFFREMVVAWVGGASSAVDAYQAAFTLAEILNHVAATGFLSITFIPIFTTCLSQGKEKEGEEFFSLILNGFGLLLLLLTIFCMIFTEPLVALLTPGLKGTLAFSQAVYMTRIVLPAQLFFFAGGLFMAVQFAKERFLIPALSPLIYNVFIILGGIFLSPKFGMAGFAWGALLGAFLGAFVLQGFGFFRMGLRYRWILNFRHPILRQYIKVTLPLILGLTMTFSTEIFFKFFGSYLPSGGIASINYAMRLTLVMSGIFGQSLGIAAYPFMAKLVAENRLMELNRLLRDALQLLCIIIPMAAWVVLLRYDIVGLLFQRGAFTAANTIRVGDILGIMIFGAFAFSAQNLASRGFYAMGNTLLPAVLCTIVTLFSIPVYWGLMHFMGGKGVALAIVLSSSIQVIVLYTYWCRKTSFSASPVYWLISKSLLLSIVLILLIEPLQKKVLAGVGVGPWGIYKFLVVTVSFFVFLIFGAKLLRISEINKFFSRIFQQCKQMFLSL